MALKVIISGTVIGRNANQDWKDGKRVGDKYYVQIANLENKKHKTIDGDEVAINPATIYDVKVNKEQFLSDDLKVGATNIELEAYQTVVTKDGKERTYYRAFELQGDEE